jgi:hypothetical protein
LTIADDVGERDTPQRRGHERKYNGTGACKHKIPAFPANIGPIRIEKGLSRPQTAGDWCDFPVYHTAPVPPSGRHPIVK